MNIFTESEIDRVVQSIIDFLQNRKERHLLKVKEEQKVTVRKKRSQQKNWSKWKKRK